MRLLFVGTKPGGGGIESHFTELTRALADRGHDVAAVVHTGGLIEIGLREHGGVQRFAGRFPTSTAPSGTWAVWRAVRRFQPDWVFTPFPREAYSVALVGRLLHVNIGFFEHLDHHVRATTAYLLPRLCDEFFVPSEYLRQRFIARGTPAHLIQVIHNPIDLKRFRPTGESRRAMRAQLGFRDQDIVVGFVGRIEQAKGSHVLAEALIGAMNCNERIKALWVGDGRWEQALDESIVSSGHATRHVRTGWVPDAAPYYQAMDMVVLPSIKPETFGRVCAEAGACGLPVIATDHGGVREAVEADETALLVPPGDASALQQGIMRLCDAELRTRMGSAGHTVISQRFDAQLIAEQFVSALKMVRPPSVILRK